MSGETYIIVGAVSFALLFAGISAGLLLGRKRGSREPGEERRQAPATIDEAKFGTQKQVTFILLGIFTGTAIQVMLGTDQAERSTILQTVINLTLLAVGYWLGASKAAADSGEAISKIIKPQADAMSRLAEGAPKEQARAVAAARAPAPEVSVVPLETPSVTPAPVNPETGNILAAEVAPVSQPNEPEKPK